MSGGRAEREGERKIPSRLRTDSLGLDLMNREIMTWAEIKSPTLNRLSHPGTPPPFSVSNVTSVTLTF